MQQAIQQRTGECIHYDESWFCPVTCSIEDLEKAIASFEIDAAGGCLRSARQQSFYSGVLHARIMIIGASGGKFGK